MAQVHNKSASALCVVVYVQCFGRTCCKKSSRNQWLMPNLVSFQLTETVQRVNLCCPADKNNSPHYCRPIDGSSFEDPAGSHIHVAALPCRQTLLRCTLRLLVDLCPSASHSAFMAAKLDKPYAKPRRKPRRHCSRPAYDGSTSTQDRPHGATCIQPIRCATQILVA